MRDGLPLSVVAYTGPAGWGGIESEHLGSRGLGTADGKGVDEAGGAGCCAPAAGCKQQRSREAEVEQRGAQNS